MLVKREGRTVPASHLQQQPEGGHGREQQAKLGRQGDLMTRHKRQRRQKGEQQARRQRPERLFHDPRDNIKLLPSCLLCTAAARTHTNGWGFVINHR